MKRPHGPQAALRSALIWTALLSAGLAQSPRERDDFVRPGENIARGKSYSWNARPNYQHCTDPSDRTQLTDGLYSEGYFWTKPSTVGWRGQRPVIVTIDLGAATSIAGASFRTAAGTAGVQWPQSIFVLVSDDKKTFREAGELVALGARNGEPPAEPYGTHRYWTDALHARGRYVTLVVSGMPYVFVDEIEIYAAAAGQQTPPAAAAEHASPEAFFQAAANRLGIQRRLREDVRGIRKLLTEAKVEAAAKKQLGAELDAIEGEIQKPPRALPPDFRAVLPLNDLHRRLFRTQARLWREAGLPQLTVWTSNRWAPLNHLAPPPRGSQPALAVAMLQNEFRSAAFNLSNAGEDALALRLHVRGLPGGVNPPYVTLHEVAWTDTFSGTPVAAALPPARRANNEFIIDVPAGLTRQVWLTFHPVDVPAGSHKGEISLSSTAGLKATIPLKLQIHPLRFPDRPTLHLGGWDYTDTDGRYEITPANRPAVIAHLREHFVDSPWATSAVLPHGSFGADGALTAKPDTARFDEWLRRWSGARQYCVFASVGASIGQHKIGAPEFDRAVGEWIRFWAAHAKSRGLKPEQLALLLVDEPHSPEQDATILAWAKPIRAADTGVLIWEDPTHKEPAKANQEMLAACHVVCPNRPRFLTNDAYRRYFAEQRPPQTALAFYSCSGPVRLLDPYAYHRLQAWSCWRHGARGSYYWAFGDAGGASSWNEYEAARNAYVPYFLDANSVTPGKHMEAIREGVEDYEYFVMLRNALAQADKRNVPAAALERARKLLENAAPRVLEAKGAQGLNWSDPKDPGLADRVRLEVLDALILLQGSMSHRPDVTQTSAKQD